MLLLHPIKPISLKEVSSYLKTGLRIARTEPFPLVRMVVYQNSLFAAQRGLPGALAKASPTYGYPL
ncbi:protein of unknown function [Kyrpidia spormannii]|uniref:Uncharacterized protein n=2 Tax=Kyrpidia spormannii TaxID=2055160 RepID=A0ACA8ZCA8_9BACL|nr:protein of unknown function [Kyrpidia spormannii]CAB3392543.1 protein of unknown function [Kyrpidia spormannii]